MGCSDGGGKSTKHSRVKRTQKKTNLIKVEYRSLVILRIGNISYVIILYRFIFVHRSLYEKFLTRKLLNAVNFVDRRTRVNSNAMDDDVEQYETVFFVRGYHIYKDVWRAAEGEDLECERETNNTHDTYAVAVTKEGRVISILIKRYNGTLRSAKMAAEAEDDNRRLLRSLRSLMVLTDPTRKNFIPNI